MKKLLEKFSDNYLTFVVYCFIGWLYEVLWMWFVVPPFKFTNRGVLFGPFLPIYGFGMLILLILLGNFMKKRHEINNFLYLTISTSTTLTFIYTTIIEYTTPKIYRVDYYLQHYGLGLLLVNIIGIILISLIVKSIKNKKVKNLDTIIILVFLGIWIISTLIEYVSHYIIDTYSHKLLWDYTKDFLNINARVNWDASRNFAIGGTFLLYTIQPIIEKFKKTTNYTTKIKLLLIIGIPMLIDFILNVVIK